MKRAAPYLCCLLFALGAAAQTVDVYPLLPGSQPRDIAPAPDGAVWYAAAGHVGRLDPASRSVRHVALPGAAEPTAIALAPDGAPWIADSGRDLILRIDPKTDAVGNYALPKFRSHAELNALAFDAGGALWFTGRSGIYGRIAPATGKAEWYDAPGGRGPLGVTAARDGTMYFASAEGAYVARVDARGVGGWLLGFVGPPLPAGGVSGLALDGGGVWIVQPGPGALSRHEGAGWHTVRLPAGAKPTAILAAQNAVWLFDETTSAILRFDFARGQFTAHALPAPVAEIARLAGRAGEIWAADSRNDRLIAVRFANAPAAP